MPTEQNESYKIYSKTGWTREGGKNKMNNDFRFAIVATVYRQSTCGITP